MATAGLAVVAGSVLVSVSAIAPERIERAYGRMQTAAVEFRADILGEIPVVRLGGEGGAAELDRCDGTFIRMLSYTRDGVPPVWAAHNGCGGDVILSAQTGDRLLIDSDGTTRLYAVVDIRHLPKTWTSTHELVGLAGGLALQTCLYGQDAMVFLGLEPVTGTAESATG